MNMMDCYLLDANAIREIQYDILRDWCSCVCTIEEVIDEIGRDKDKAKLLTQKGRVCTLNKNGYKIMGNIMQLNNVRKLVDYFYNHGAGDVAILAFALQMSSEQEARLVKDNIVVVTNDKGVQNACHELHVKYLSTAQFKDTLVYV